MHGGRETCCHGNLLCWCEWRGVEEFFSDQGMRRWTFHGIKLVFGFPFRSCTFKSYNSIHYFLLVFCNVRLVS